MSARDRFSLVGKVIADKYAVNRVLGEGGYGVVYEARNLVLDMPIAMKVLKPAWGSVDEQQKGIASFQREARILATLSHTAIVRFYDVGILSDGGLPYAVFELLSGKTIADDLVERTAAKRHYHKAELASLFGAILEGVAFAHERGIIHRDLKPANVMLVTDAGKVVPKILDFGTARALDPVKPSAASIGAFTPLYAAPEQWDRSRGDIGPATDVYALGILLAEMSLLRYPFPYDPRRGVPELLITKLDDKKRPALAAERTDLPPQLEQMVNRALRVRPSERQANAAELLTQFRDAMKSTAATAPMPRVPPVQTQKSSTVAMPSRPLPLPPPSPSTPQIAVAPASPSSPYLAAAPPTRGSSIASPSNPSPMAFAPTAVATRPVSEPPAPPTHSPLPWIMVAVFLGIAGLAIAGGIYFATRGHDAPAPAVSATPSATPVATPVPTTTASGTQVIVGGVNGADPFWTPAEALGVAEANRGALAKCAEDALAVDKSLAKTFTTIVTPKEDGPVESVMCNAESDGPGESALCGCVQRVIGGWRFPKAHGRVGLLTSGPLTYEFRIITP